MNGVVDRNRALHGDIVALRLKHRNDWKIMDESVGKSSAESGSSSTNDVSVSNGQDGLKGGNGDASTAVNGLSSDLTEKATLSTPQIRKTMQRTFSTPSDMKDRTFTDDELQKVAEVVAITQRKHSRTGVGFLRMPKNAGARNALFSPTDPKVPRMMIKLEECPKSLLYYLCQLSDCRFLGLLLNSGGLLLLKWFLVEVLSSDGLSR